MTQNIDWPKIQSAWFMMPHKFTFGSSQTHARHPQMNLWAVGWEKNKKSFSSFGHLRFCFTFARLLI